MKRLGIQQLATLVVLAVGSMAGQAQAAAIGTGLFGKSPHILGKVVVGESDEVKRDFAEGLKGPLKIRIDPGSHSVELMRIGMWLREQEAALKIEKACVAACAKFILLAGKPASIEPGTVIAFGGVSMFEILATLKEQIDAGELFDPNDERTRASRDGFLEKARKGLAPALELRAAFRQLNPPHHDFISTITTRWKVTELSFSDQHFNMRFAPPSGSCLWWVPDETGLQQLGLKVPNYKPAPLAEAAKLLKVAESLIYVGAVPEPGTPPPTCKAPENFTPWLVP